MNIKKIAILITSHNRREKTLACLKALYNCTLPGDIIYVTYLVDDGSLDGTGPAVKNAFPEVNVIQGNGKLFWAGGMRLAWKEALKNDFDGYLLLNDDTILYPSAISGLLLTHDYSLNRFKKEGIYVGTACDPVTGGYTYGGKKITNAISGRSKHVKPLDNMFQCCDFANANILFVPKQVVETIGILPEKYTHLLADYDYTLNASKSGIPLIVSKEYCGECQNDHVKTWLSEDHSLAERMKYLKSPKYLAYSEYLYFIRKYFPLYLPVSFIKLWGKTIFPSVWDKYKRLN